MKMNKIDLNNLDKSTWSTFRFDQIASSISKRVDPNNTDLKYYIGLEHIDSENIHITRMGSPDDVNGQKLRCYPGDVIFGRRRAYQRKAAVCEVDGFCSAHSLVLRANPEIIDPKLFPFFLHSDAFMHRAVDISVGSLSPTINWGTLKKQEYLLPPKDQQAQLTELLWTMDDLIEKETSLQKSIESLEKSLTMKIKRTYFDKSLKVAPEEECADGRLESFFQLQRGFDLTKKNAVGGTVPVISSSGLSYYHNESQCEPPGVVTGRKGKLGEAYFLNEPYWPHDTSLWVKDFKGNEAKFVFWFLKSINLETFNAATAVPTLNRNVLHPINIRFPNVETQKRLCERLDKVNSEKERVCRLCLSAGNLRKSLINQVF